MWHIFRVAAIARARARAGAGVVGRRCASSEVSPQASAVHSFASAWYNIFGASTARYATFLTVGVIGAELFTNSATDALWEANNAGKTYAQVNWSRFDPPDDDEDDDDEDDDDDDEDDEEEDDDE